MRGTGFTFAKTIAIRIAVENHSKKLPMKPSHHKEKLYGWAAVATSDKLKLTIIIRKDKDEIVSAVKKRQPVFNRVADTAFTIKLFCLIEISRFSEINLQDFTLK